MGEVTVIAALIFVAFLAGIAIKQIGLPPLVGFLVAGFVLRGVGFETPEGMESIANFGVTLLLFTIGLKLQVKSLLRPEVWAGTTSHMLVTTLVLAGVVWGLGACGIPLFNELDFRTALVVGFALSFSSTVFAAKAFEDRAELATRHATAAISILIMQDVIAVVFLTVSKGTVPSPWAFALVLLPLLRPVFNWLLSKVDHGELLLLFGFVMTFAGYGLFDWLGLKGDLGAIAFGMLLASSPRAGELAKVLFGFKDLFLVAFFLSIGLSEDMTGKAVIAALILVPFLVPKAFGFFWLLCGFRYRARPSFFAGLGLANFSEFGLIVGVVAVNDLGWLSGEWLVAIAVLVSLSFVVASPLNVSPSRIYEKLKGRLRRFERQARLEEDQPIVSNDPEAVIFGMGRIGTGAYDWLREHRGMRVVGVDSCISTVEMQKAEGRSVVLGDGTDPGFWDRVDKSARPKMVFIATRNYRATRRIAERLMSFNSEARITALVRHPDEAEELKELGVCSAFDLYQEAGTALAAESCNEMEEANA